MNITLMTNKDIAAACEGFNGVIAQDNLVYMPLTDDTFRAHFFTDTPQVKKLTALAFEGEQIAGFVSGVYMPQNGKAYISFIWVAPAFRRQGLGRKLLLWLEQQLVSQQGEKVEKFDIVFFNPVNFTWIVPGTPGHDHPNAPGVDVSTGAYLFFKNCGYRDYAMQNSYYLPLAQYEYPEELAQRLVELQGRGITIPYYDASIHSGLADLMDVLGNEDWRQRVLENVHRPDGGDPLLVVVSDNRVCGFTGPLAVQPSGRGYFAGIAVHPDFRGMGAGKVLFAALARGLKQQGAGYMTLFTGENNPARNIYEAAGFKIVKTWADMRKEA